MSIYEYNEEEHMRMEREDAFKDGHEVGRETGFVEGREAGFTEGHEAGLTEGRSEMLKLISKMTADGLGDMIGRLGKEPEFYDEMIRKYIR